MVEIFMQFFSTDQNLAVYLAKCFGFPFVITLWLMWTNNEIKAWQATKQQ